MQMRRGGMEETEEAQEAEVEAAEEDGGESEEERDVEPGAEAVMDWHEDHAEHIGQPDGKEDQPATGDAVQPRPEAQFRKEFAVGGVGAEDRAEEGGEEEGESGGIRVKGDGREGESDGEKEPVADNGEAGGVEEAGAFGPVLAGAAAPDAEGEPVKGRGFGGGAEKSSQGSKHQHEESRMQRTES